MDREAIEHIKTFSIDREFIETNSQKHRWTENATIAVKKERSKCSIDSLAVKRCPVAIEIA